MTTGIHSNDLPKFGRFGVGYAAAAKAIAARNGGQAPAYNPRPAYTPAAPVVPRATPPATPTATGLRVGMRVRGADVVPADYETVNRNFRGVIREFGVFGKTGQNDVKVKMEGTNRIFNVHSRYLVPA